MTEIWQEPARGGFPPDGFIELPGIDRARAIVQGLVPRSPLSRLLGMRITHASIGTATAVMPASPWLQKSPLISGITVQGVPGTVDLLPLAAATLGTAAGTTASPGTDISVQTIGVHYIRRPTTAMESFVARGRCLAAGPSRATVEVQIEDAEGRLVVHSTGQTVFWPSDEPRGTSRVSLERVIDPAFPTPDPPARPLGNAYQPVPLWRLMGITMANLQADSCALSMKPNDWLRGRRRHTAPLALQVLLENAFYSVTGAITPLDRGLIEHEHHMTFVRSIGVRDEGEFVARVTISARTGDSMLVIGDVFTEAGDRVLAGSSTCSIVDVAHARAEVSAERVLAAVLYTDIVGSTPHAERLGDARWKELLEEFRDRTSKQVTTFRGREVKWTGDGILATFDSPARAVQCARALHDAAQRQNIQIRAGIHVGECELMGTDVAGIAVHVAQRVLDKAEPGTTLVTSTVREAAAGSGLRFTDKGRHELKGVEGEWQLYAIEQ